MESTTGTKVVPASPPNGDATDSDLARMSTYGAQEAKGQLNT